MINRIKELCKEEKINIAILEKKLGLSNGQIGKWKKSEPRAKDIKAIADYFNKTMEYILIGEVERKEEEKELLKYYQGSSKNGKKNIMHIAKMEYEEQMEIEKEEKKSS